MPALWTVLLIGGGVALFGFAFFVAGWLWAQCDGWYEEKPDA